VMLSAALWIWTSNPMLFLIAVVGTWRLFTKDSPGEPDNEGLLRFAAILAALTLLGVLSPLPQSAAGSL
jgi:hypothetical protein